MVSPDEAKPVPLQSPRCRGMNCTRFAVTCASPWPRPSVCLEHHGQGRPHGALCGSAWPVGLGTRQSLWGVPHPSPPSWPHLPAGVLPRTPGMCRWGEVAWPWAGEEGSAAGEGVMAHLGGRCCRARSQRDRFMLPAAPATPASPCNSRSHASLPLTPCPIQMGPCLPHESWGVDPPC